MNSYPQAYEQDEETGSQTLPCEGKLIFATQKQAEAAAAVNTYWYRGAKLKAYQCRYCGHWHLSSSAE